MLERGLAYRKKSRVNWCPKCCTVLANEQVINGGYCWRHEDTLGESREIEQGFLKTTAYAGQLLDDLKHLEGKWPERVILMQRNWRGKSQGAKVKCAGADVGRRGDSELWRKCGLPVRVVVEQKQVESSRSKPEEDKKLAAGARSGLDVGEEAFTEYGVSVNSGPFSGMDSETAIAKMAAFAEQKGF